MSHEFDCASGFLGFALAAIGMLILSVVYGAGVDEGKKQAGTEKEKKQ